MKTTPEEILLKRINEYIEKRKNLPKMPESPSSPKMPIKPDGHGEKVLAYSVVKEYKEQVQKYRADTEQHNKYCKQFSTDIDDWSTKRMELKDEFNKICSDEQLGIGTVLPIRNWLFEKEIAMFPKRERLTDITENPIRYKIEVLKDEFTFKVTCLSKVRKK